MYIPNSIIVECVLKCREKPKEEDGEKKRNTNAEI